jgi:hypothetical protein
MARDISGNMSLIVSPAAVSGNTISSADHNSNINDIVSEITQSVSRYGYGAMQTGAQFKADPGTDAAPGITFNGDLDTGLYRIGANNIGIAANATKVQEWNGTQSLFSNGTVSLPGIGFSSDPDCGAYRIGANNIGIAVNAAKVLDIATTGLAVTGLLTSSAGATITQSTANSNAITATGNGTGAGLTATSGTTDNSGAIVGTANAGATNAFGGFLTGRGAGAGLQTTGGATGPGVKAIAGTTQTGGAQSTAIQITNGSIDMSGVAYLNSNVGVTDGIVPNNIPKAWVSVDISNADPFVPTVQDGFNIASAARQGTGSTLRITFATALANANYAASVLFIASTGSTALIGNVEGRATTYIDVGVRRMSTEAATDMDALGFSGTFMVIVFGIQ